MLILLSESRSVLHYYPLAEHRPADFGKFKRIYQLSCSCISAIKSTRGQYGTCLPSPVPSINVPSFKNMDLLYLFRCAVLAVVGSVSFRLGRLL